MPDKRQPGQPISGLSSRVWNNLVDVRDKIRAKELGDPGNRKKALARDPDRCLIRNVGAAAFERFDAVEIVAPRKLPSEDLEQWAMGYPLYGAQTPSKDCARIAIMEESVSHEDAGIGGAVISGIARTIVDVQHADHEFAEVAEGSRRIVSTASPFAYIEILWKESGIGEKYADVLLSTRRDAMHEFCLAENHPGRGVIFDVKLGTWDPAAHEWCFEGDNVKAIDWRFDVPYPTAGARGHGYFRPSNTHGQILIPIDMDCSSPGVCPGCGGSE